MQNMKNGTFILQILQCCWSRLEHSYQWLHVKDVLTVETNLQLKSSLTTEPIPPSHLHNGPLTPSCEWMRAEWAGLRPITLQLAVINIQPASILMQKKQVIRSSLTCSIYIMWGFVWFKYLEGHLDILFFPNLFHFTFLTPNCSEMYFYTQKWYF